jgi:shikimate dehydrogenase
MKKLCVIGWPISHSRSPLIHNYWIKKHGFDGIYEKHALEPHALQSFVENFRSLGLSGCNVTVPHKETIIPFLPHVDDEAKRLVAVNTLYLKNGELRGTNTDGEGFCAHLQQSHPTFHIKGNSIIVIGAGGAAKAIIGTLLDQGAKEILLVNRSTDRAKNLQAQFGAEIKYLGDIQSIDAMKNCDLLVNTSSLGMQGQPPLNINLDTLNPHAIVADIVYAPLETELLKQAKARGNPTLGGLGMLLHQAVRGFELWFGVRPEVTPELQDFVVADLMTART